MEGRTSRDKKADGITGTYTLLKNDDTIIDKAVLKILYNKLSA
jgi:hypothetical protein